MHAKRKMMAAAQARNSGSFPHSSNSSPVSTPDHHSSSPSGLQRPHSAHLNRTFPKAIDSISDEILKQVQTKSNSSNITVEIKTHPVPTVLQEERPIQIEPSTIPINLPTISSNVAITTSVSELEGITLPNMATEGLDEGEIRRGMQKI